MKVWVKRQLCAFLLLSYVLLHVKQSYESSEEEREDGEALLVTWRPRVDALSRKQWRRRKRRRNRLMAASRTRDAITTARCGLRCVASLVFVRLVKAGDVELNPGPRDKRAPLSRKDHQWLCEAVSAASAKWRNFGMALKFSYHELGAIVNERSLTTDEHYMQELLSRWLKWAPPNHPLPCVEDLATALCSVGEERTAYDLYMYLESNDEKMFPSESACTSATCQIASDETQTTFFRCGCGRCGFEHFCMYGCPKSNSGPNFPVLSLKELKEEDRKLLEGKLLSDARHIRFEFDSFLKYLLTFVKKLKLQEFKIFVKTLGESVSTHGSLPLLGKRSDIIDSCTSTLELLSILGDYFSWFNYEVIERLVNTFAGKKEKVSLELKKYTRKFVEYCKRNIFEFPQPISSVPKGGRVLFVEASNVSNGTHVKALLIELAGVFRINLLSLKLISASAGCVVLVLSLPLSVAEKIFPLDSGQEAELVSLDKVHKLFCGVYYFNASLVVLRVEVLHTIDEVVEEEIKRADILQSLKIDQLELVQKQRNELSSVELQICELGQRMSRDGVEELTDTAESIRKSIDSLRNHLLSMKQQLIPLVLEKKLKKCLEACAGEEFTSSKKRFFFEFRVDESDTTKLIKGLRIESINDGLCRISVEDFHEVRVYLPEAVDVAGPGRARAVALGGAVGTVGGAVAGAAIGSIVPIAGTVIGGFSGAVIGGVGGNVIGSTGAGIRTAVAVDKQPEKINVSKVFKRFGGYEHKKDEKRVYCTIKLH